MVKTETRHLMCRLTEDELETESKTLTILLTEKAHLEIEKSSSNKRFSDLIKAKDVQIEKQIPIVRDREIEREVNVQIEFNVPDPGKKRITRLDTMEIIDECQMTDSECQDLFINQSEPPQDLPALPAPAEVIDAEEVQSDPSDETSGDASEGTCSQCGITGKCIFHVDREKPLCGVCLDKKNRKNIDKLEREIAAKHRILMRPSFGYGCRKDFANTTVFRFMFCDEDRSDGKCSSWGTPIYLRGNYQTTGSQAEIYYRSLIEAGVTAEA